MIYTTIAGIITLVLWLIMMMFLVRLRNQHSEEPEDLNKLHGEALLAFVHDKFHVSTYAIFESAIMAQGGLVQVDFIDEMFDNYIRHQKVPTMVHRHMIKLLKGEVPLHHSPTESTLIS